VPDLDQYHVVVALTPDANKVLPRHPTNASGSTWPLDDPALCEARQNKCAGHMKPPFSSSPSACLVEAVLDEERPSHTVNPGNPA
jgi:hypothetical protein